ncbi:MAG: hypothetical protein H0U70_05685 [Tatlockia sp.]|nr:hypothetical protein [Tatlockia sp.]
MAVESENKSLLKLAGIMAFCITIMGIFIATGKFMAMIAAISGGGLAFFIVGYGTCAVGLAKGIQLLYQGELGKGSLLTISSAVILGVLIGATIGILMPGVGTLIGPLAGAGLGFLVSLPIVAIGLCYHILKKPNHNDDVKETTLADVSITEPQQRLWKPVQPNPEKTAYFDQTNANQNRNDDRNIELSPITEHNNTDNSLTSGIFS